MILYLSAYIAGQYVIKLSHTYVAFGNFKENLVNEPLLPPSGLKIVTMIPYSEAHIVAFADNKQIRGYIRYIPIIFRKIEDMTGKFEMIHFME